MIKRSFLATACVLSFLLIGTKSIQAQKNTEVKEWHFLVEPYMMFPNMKGTVGLGVLPDVELDENPGDIFRNLQFGAMVYAEATNNKWTISSDMLYMNLGVDLDPTTVINSGNVDAKQLGWEIDGLYKALPWLDVGVGGVLNNVKSGLDLTLNTPTGTVNEKREITKTWVDPTIVARVIYPTNKWQFQFRGNIGGFGIGSQLSWQLQLYAGYRFSKLFQLSAGYRVMGLDYDKGSGQDRFLYDVNTFGPVIRFGFHF